MKILLVEDDPFTRTVLNQTLRDHHYNVDVAADGQAGLELAQAYKYDLLVLDVMLPLLDGISLCKQLRSQGFEDSIILLTAKESSNDQIIGLDAGADDYIIKPFDPEMLMARIRALFRRKNDIISSIIQWKNLQLNLNNCEVNSGDKPIYLTAKEYSLLELFLVNPKRIFSRAVILERLWDMSESPGEETVSTHIKCLRQKLKKAGVSDPIETVYGLGYRLKKPFEQEQPKNKTKTQVPTQKPLDSHQKVIDLTTKAWNKFKDLYSEKITILEQAVNALIEGNLPPEILQQAKHEAHKLAGSLGMFGLVNGSQLARQLEHLLESEQERSRLQNSQKLTTKQKHEIVNWVIQLKQEIEQGSIHLSSTSSRSISTPLILIIDDDLALAEQVRIEAKPWNLRVEIAIDLAVARQIIMQTPPDIILLDLNFESAIEDGFTLLEELSQSRPNLPVVVFTGRDSLSDRIKVVRQGARAFLHKPLPVHEIMKTVTNVLAQNTLSLKNRVMIVDDDSLTLTIIADLLKPWQVEVTMLNNSEEFWQVLTTTNPDLLILDLEMPKFNGIELCQVVRNDPKWQNLPILFLSAYSKEKIVQKIFTAGADDYISKSSGNTEILNRIIRRLKLK